MGKTIFPVGIFPESESVSRSVTPNSETPRTVARQAPLSKGFSRQEQWGGLSFPSPGDFPNPGISPRSPTSQADSLPFELPRKLGVCLIA